MKPLCYNDPHQTTYGGECYHNTCMHHDRFEPICAADATAKKLQLRGYNLDELGLDNPYTQNLGDV